MREVQNEPVKVAEDVVPKEERTNPQLTNVLVSENGQVSISFSQDMLWPKNWVMKYMADTQTNDFDKEKIDPGTACLPTFLYE